MENRLIRVLAVVAVLLSTSVAADAAVRVDDPGLDVLEVEVEVTGELHRLTIEPLAGEYADATAIVTEDGEVVRVPAEDVEGVPAGALVEILALVDEETGLEDVGDVLDEEAGVEVLRMDVLDVPDGADVGTDSPIELAALPNPTSRVVNLVTANFPGQAAPAIAPSRLSSDLTTQVAPYWYDSTNGGIRLSSGTQTVAGTYSSWGSTGTCTTTQILDILSWASARSGISGPASGQGKHVVMYTPRALSCSFAGVAHVGNGGVAWLNGPDGGAPAWHVMAHELGHTLTLGHSNTRVDCTPSPDSSSCHWGEYGDAFDVMGLPVGGGPGPLSAAQLDNLGMLTTASTRVAGSPTSVTLAPVGALSGTRFLAFATGESRYYVEYRGAVGRDADLATTRKGCPHGVSYCTLTRYTPGVIVHRIDGSLGAGVATNLLAPGGGTSFTLGAGGSFRTANGAFAVIVDAVSASGASIRLVDGASMLAGASPIGMLDSVKGVVGGVEVAGWAIDPDTTASGYVWVDVSGQGRPVLANVSRADVGAAYPGYGNNHGFSVVIPAGPGSRQVCVTAVNSGPGSNTSLGCRTVTVLDASPIGRIDFAVGVLGGVRVSGWALDPETSASTYVWVDVSGRGGPVLASATRNDIGAAFPGLGSSHGFDIVIPAAGGSQQVCMTAVNTGMGSNTSLGCRTVTVPDASPIGRIDSAGGVRGGVQVNGWAVDPETSASIYIWVDVSGRGGPLVANGNRPDIGAAFPGLGSAHGFTSTIPAAPGLQRVCVTAVNTGSGSNRSLGCSTVLVTSS